MLWRAVEAANVLLQWALIPMGSRQNDQETPTVSVTVAVVSWPRPHSPAPPAPPALPSQKQQDPPDESPRAPSPPPSARIAAAASGAIRRGRLVQLQRAPAEGFSGDIPSVATVRSQCKLELPKVRQTQALDVKMLLHTDFGVAYTDMVLLYRGHPVLDFEVLNMLPDWTATPYLQLIVLPGSHGAMQRYCMHFCVCPRYHHWFTCGGLPITVAALKVMQQKTLRELSWVRLYTHIAMSVHHDDWLSRQAVGELPFKAFPFY